MTNEEEERDEEDDHCLDKEPVRLYTFSKAMMASFDNFTRQNCFCQHLGHKALCFWPYNNVSDCVVAIV